MSQALRKITGLAHRQACACLFINPLRQRGGGTGRNGSPGGAEASAEVGERVA